MMKKENVKKKYYRFCSQTNIISKAGFLLRNCITLGGFFNWASVSLTLRKGERKDHWIHLKLMYWELHKTIQGQSAWYLGGGHMCSLPKARRSMWEDSSQFGVDINLLSGSLDAETESLIAWKPTPEHRFLAAGLPREAMECHCEGLWQVVALLM